MTALPQRFPLYRDRDGRKGPLTLEARDAVRRAKQPGFGMDLRELRDHQPGDSFKMIAWQATARRRKLISRVYEPAVRRSVWLLLDTSPSMFWGQPGGARIDFALETAYQLSALLTDQGNKVGLVVYDALPRLQIKPGTGRVQQHRILEALLETPSLWHDDRTEVTHRELLDVVADWFAAHQGRRFRLPLALREAGWIRYGSHDVPRLVAAARAELLEVLKDRTPLVPASNYSADPRQAILRAFCRHVGIPLPLDPTPRPGAQAVGLERSMRAVLGHGGGPHTIIVISDLHTATRLESLRRVTGGARRHHHQVIVVCPDDLAFEGGEALETPTALTQAVDAAAAARASLNLATVEAYLRPAGVSVIRCSARDSVPLVVRRLSMEA